MLAADGDVPLIAPDLNLLAIANGSSARVDPLHHSRLARIHREIVKEKFCQGSDSGGDLDGGWFGNR